MKIYVGDHWLPFPESVHGGLIIYAANNKDEVVELARNLGYTPEAMGFLCRQPSLKGFKEGLREIGTTDMFSEPQVIESFET